MPRFRVVMTQPLAKPENPFLPSLINRLTPTRTAELDADSEQQVRDYFADAKAKDFPSVRGYELQSITAL